MGAVLERYADGTGTVWRKIGAVSGMAWFGLVYRSGIGAAGNLDALARVLL